MKTRFFVFLAATLVVMAINAEQIGWNEYDVTSSSGLDDVSFSDGEFELVIIGTRSKFVIDASNAYFGDAESQTQFTHRLKTGSPSSSGNYFVLEIPRAGKLYMYARCASSSATDRHIIMRANGIEVFNQIVKESDAIQVPGLDETNPEILTKVYPVHVIDVESGTLVVTYPNGSMNFYGFCLDSQYVPTCEVKIGDLNYYLNSDKTAVVVYGDGWPDDNYSGLTTANIQSSIVYKSVTYTVTGIGREAFRDCSSLTSVTIPNSVTSIGDDAFWGCSGLTSVTIPNSVTSIGDYAFSGVLNIVYEGSATGSPWGAKNVNGYVDGYLVYSDSTKTVLLGCSSAAIGEIIIPNSVTSIGSSAFYGCSGLTSVTIPNSVTSIGDYAFSGCSGLTSVTIPNSVTSIGEYAFAGCWGLTSVTIPNSVTNIGGGAFKGCWGLTSLVYNAHVFAFMPTSYSGAYTIPDGIESIAGGAFDGCTGLTSIEIPNSVTSIGGSAFYKCSGLTSVTIPNSVTSIGGDAFYNCRGLTSVTIPNSVTSIGGGAFYGCTGLASVTIPNSVTSIGNYAFSQCRGLTSVTIPNSVTSIGGSAFRDCSSLTSVTIEAEIPPTLGSWAFDRTNDYPIYVPCGTFEAYKTAWADYASRIEYGPAIDFITTYAENGHVDISAYNNTNATKCDGELFTLTPIPNYGYHFSQWSDGLKDNPRIAQITQDTTFTAEFAPDRIGTCGKDLALVWSYDPANKVLTIGNAGSFTENMQFGVEAPNEMEELVIGNSVTAIGANAFAGISSLKKVSIGESVKTIGEQAFYNCVNLETIFNYRPTPTNAYSTAFDGVDKFACSLYVLPSSIDMYKNASVWRDFYYTYAIGAEEATVTTNDVTVEPQNNAVTVTWPTSENAASYTIQITKDGVLFCTLIFNANGQLTGIAFAPSRNGQAHAPAAVMTANGLQFTVTGLNSGTQYGYNLTAKDANDQTVATYSGSFTTTSEGDAQGLEDVQSDNVQCTKVLINGQIFIIRGDKTYTLQGQEVK